jgi:hypothetical protein
MNEPIWKNEPKWADRLMKSNGGNYFWCNTEQYLLASPSFKIRKFGEKNSFTLDRLELVGMRPDPWKEGEERMKAIGPNGNEGEHYEQVKRSVVEIDNNNKYSRKIKSISVGGQIFDIYVDVYDVLDAFECANSASEHGVKKLLKPGGRGAKTVIQDLKEARDSINRSIELEEAK